MYAADMTSDKKNNQATMEVSLYAFKHAFESYFLLYILDDPSLTYVRSSRSHAKCGLLHITTST